MAADIAAAIGIVGALNLETEMFADCREYGAACLVETSGPGVPAAAAGAERALARGAGCLISWGTAGGLAHVEPGEIVLPDYVADPRNRVLTTDEVLTGRLACVFEGIARIHRGILASVAAPVTSVAGKRALAESSGAIAVDMESSAIGDVAARAGVPLIVVRVIVDRNDRAVPAAATAGMDGPRTRPARVLGGLLKSPLDTASVIALGLAARRARRTLLACAPRMIAALSADRLN